MDLPKVRTISKAEIDANNNGTKPLGEEEMYETPKQSVFSPNINERKTKYTKRK